MNPRAIGAVGLALLFGGGLGPGGVAAQSLEQRIDRVEDGTVAFHFEVADDVQVCDHSIRQGPDGRGMHWGRWSDREQETCTDGPLELRVELRDGRVEDIDAGRIGAEPSDVDLGTVTPAEAAAWLVEIPWRARTDDGVGEAYMAIRFMEGVNVDARIAAAVEDRGLNPEIRQQVMFWAGQLVAGRMAERLRDVVLAEDEDQDVRDHAIFALSQRGAEEAVPLLMELASDAPHL